MKTVKTEQIALTTYSFGEYNYYLFNTLLMVPDTNKKNITDRPIGTKGK